MIAVWLWVKKYWEWLLGALLLVLGFAFGISMKKQPVILPEDKERKDIEKEAAKEEQQIQLDVKKQQNELTEQHTKDLQQVITEEQKKSQELANDPNATNDYLKQVGQLVRGGDSNGGQQ